MCIVGAGESDGAGDTVSLWIVGAGESDGAGETVTLEVEFADGAKEGAGDDVSSFPRSTTASLHVTKAAESSASRNTKQLCRMIGCMAVDFCDR